MKKIQIVQKMAKVLIDYTLYGWYNWSKLNKIQNKEGEK